MLYSYLKKKKKKSPEPLQLDKATYIGSSDPLYVI